MNVIKSIRLNQNIKKEILKYKLMGFSRKEISEKTGYRYLDGITKVFKEYGIQTNNRIEQNKELSYNIIKLYKEGLSLSKISKETKVSYQSISKFLNDSNIRKCIKAASYTQNDKYFHIIDNEEKAYWIGFIIADGNLASRSNTLTIVAHEKDQDHITKFLKCINSTNNIKKYKTVKNGTTSYMVRACIYSPTVFETLTDKGIFPKKTDNLPDTILHHIPDNLFNHFLRGIFDGDGCWKSRKEKCPSFNIVNKSYVFLNALKERMDRAINIDCKIYKHSNIGSLELSKISANVKLFNFMYSDSTIHLDRKHDKILKFIQTLPDYKSYIQ